jgi:hypothetical protein
MHSDWAKAWPDWEQRRRRRSPRRDGDPWNWTVADQGSRLVAATVTVTEDGRLVRVVEVSR